MRGCGGSTIASEHLSVVRKGTARRLLSVTANVLDRCSRDGLLLGIDSTIRRSYRDACNRLVGSAAGAAFLIDGDGRARNCCRICLGGGVDDERIGGGVPSTTSGGRNESTTSDGGNNLNGARYIQQMIYKKRMERESGRIHQSLRQSKKEYSAGG